MSHSKHISWALLDQMLVSGTNFLIGVFLVRLLGMEQYGMFILVWMIVQFFTSVQSALIVAPMLTIAPKIPIAERPNYFAATLALQTGLVGFIVFLAHMNFLNPDSYKPIWLAGNSMLTLVALVSSRLRKQARNGNPKEIKI
ncbi:hypothetical protein TI04_09020 [Achromatium sp. WMS2]|nr:hypothetical protein TI04_09020 [Achromatium sp. WMS2]